MYFKYVTLNRREFVYVHKSDAYKNAICIILYSLVTLWLWSNTSLSFSETELRGQREQNTNLSLQSSKKSSAVTAEGLLAEEATLAVTETVSPNPWCSGTPDKDQANCRAGDTLRRQTDRLVRDRVGASSVGSGGSVPSWETAKTAGQPKFFKNNFRFRKCCGLFGSRRCNILNKPGMLLFNVGKVGLSCTKRKQVTFSPHPGESEDEEW